MPEAEKREAQKAEKRGETVHFFIYICILLIVSAFLTRDLRFLSV